MLSHPKRQIHTTPDTYIHTVKGDLENSFDSELIAFKVRTPSTTDVEKPYEVQLSVMDLEPLTTSPQATIEYWRPIDLICSAIIIQQPQQREALDRIDSINLAAALSSYLYMRTYSLEDMQTYSPPKDIENPENKVIAGPNRTIGGGGYFPLTVAYGEQEGRTVLGFQIRWRASIMSSQQFEQQFDAVGPPPPDPHPVEPATAIFGRGALQDGPYGDSELLAGSRS